jgi:putative transposase
MAQSLSSVCLHAVFSTRERLPSIANTAELHAVIGQISKRMDCQPLIVGGVADHVHILAAQSRTVTVANWIKEIKRLSSIHLKASNPDFAWQAGYGVFSVGPDQLATVRAYIANQEEHHRRTSFQDEFRRLLGDHAVDWDEKYVWE